MSYPNQLKITIHKPKYDDDYVEENGAFMQIGIDEWQEAYRSVKGNASAMGMYFYLASNKDGYGKYLSSADFENAVGKSRSSYHRGIDLLKEQGYIYKDASGSFNFATTPQKSYEVELHNWEGGDAKKKQQSSKSDNENSQKCNTSASDLTIEINKNKDNKENKKDIEARISYLRRFVSPQGQIIYGRNQGYWLNYLEPNFWYMTTDEQTELLKNKTDLSWTDARIIVENILDVDEFNEKMRKMKMLSDHKF